jgi:hypothetical protein
MLTVELYNRNNSWSPNYNYWRKVQQADTITSLIQLISSDIFHSSQNRYTQIYQDTDVSKHIQCVNTSVSRKSQGTYFETEGVYICIGHMYSPMKLKSNYKWGSMLATLVLMPIRASPTVAANSAGAKITRHLARESPPSRYQVHYSNFVLKNIC